MSNHQDMRAFLFVFEIDPIVVGTVYERLPMHSTLMPWFRTDVDDNTVLSIAREALSGHRAVALVSEASALFGKKHTIPVFTLQCADALLSLHIDLYAALSLANAAHIEPLYVGDGYRPHVTTCDNRFFPVGSKKIVENVWMFEALNAEKLIDKKAVAKIRLS